MFPDNDPTTEADDAKFAEFWSASIETTSDQKSSSPTSSHTSSRRFLAVVCTMAGLLAGALFGMTGSGPSSAAAEPGCPHSSDPSRGPKKCNESTTTTQTPTSQPPTTEATTTLPPTSVSPTTQLPTTQPPTTQSPTTQPSTSQPPTTQPNSDRQLTEADFTYRGAFMAPADDSGGSSFAYGGRAAAFNPYGDPGNTDAFRGSLFVAGHPLQNPGIAEIDIPEPELHFGSTEGLPVAEFLQPFSDITNGRAMQYIGSSDVGGINEFRFGGLEVVDSSIGPRLHWSAWQYYHVAETDVPSHGHSSLDLSNPDPQGPWHLGDYDMAETSGYLFTAPVDFADQHFDGHRLLSGFQHNATGSRNSWGPPFFAYTAPDQAEPLTRLDAIELTNYPYPNHKLIGHEQTNLSPGADWITTSDGVDAIVVTGNESLEGSRYGEPEPGDCNSGKGYLGAPYAPRVLFYDPADLARVAAGEIQPWDVEPYRTWNPMDYLIPTCDWLLSSLSYDEASRRMYIVQWKADLSQNIYAPVPVIHVFDVN